MYSLNATKAIAQLCQRKQVIDFWTVTIYTKTKQDLSFWRIISQLAANST
jgi:hypothetical protein